MELTNFLQQLIHDDQLPVSLAHKIAQAAGIALDTRKHDINKAVFAIYEALDLLQNNNLLQKGEGEVFLNLVQLIENKVFLVNNGVSTND
jgi:hypothetical protein